MQYYVIAADGQKYGPADVTTLAQWAQEGRLTADTMLESMVDATRVPASQVTGIFPAATSGVAQPGPGAPYAAPQQFGTYQRPYVGDDGSTDVNWGWACCVFGFCCCPIIPAAIAIYLGNRAKSKGHPQGNAVMIVGAIVVALNIIGLIVRFVLMASSFGTPPFGR